MIEIRLADVRGPLPPDFPSLRDQARRDGFTFLDKLEREYPGSFASPDARLFAATQAGRLVAIGGIAPDPYTTGQGQGRLRQLYCAPEFRGKGIGKRIVSTCMSFARERFRIVNLRVPAHGGAGAFYECLGFVRVENDPTRIILMSEGQISPL